MQYSGTGLPVDYSGHASAFYRLVASDVAMPEPFRSETTVYECPGKDSGANECARHCASELGDDLVAFSVKAINAPPSPPTPALPPTPPASPPSPLPPWGEQFNGATDSCCTAGFYCGAECRDGGVGSTFPPVCGYGSQVCAAVFELIALDTHTLKPDYSLSLMEPILF